MSYETNIAKENINQEYLGIFTIRRQLSTTWTSGGGIYSASFEYGNVVGVSYLHLSSGVPADSWTDLTKETSQAGVGAGEFYFDRSTNTLYVGNNFNTSGANTYAVVVFYDLYMATKPTNWYADPLDVTSDQVYFDGVIVKPPILTNDMSQDLFGFVPLNVSSMECGDVQNFWAQHLYDSSFNKAKLKIYHVAGPLIVSNIAFSLRAYGLGLTVTDDSVRFELSEPQSILDQEFRFTSNLYDDSTTSFFPDTADGGAVAKPIRRVYGKVEDVPLVNLSPTTSDTATTSDNRVWTFGSDADTYGNTVFHFQSSPPTAVNTTTQTISSDSDELSVGDSVILYDGTNTRYARVTEIPSPPIRFFHTALSAAMAQSVLGTITKYPANKITIVQNGVQYFPLAGRDYTVYSTGGFEGIQFVNNFEATIGMDTLQSSDTVVATINGIQDLPEISSSDFGSLDSTINSLCQGVPIIYSLLRAAGILESEIDTDTFEDLQADIGDTMRVGFVSPQRTGDSMPTFRQIILRILQSYMLRLFVDNNGLWTLRQMGPLPGTPDQSFDDFDIEKGSFEYKISYDDLISKANVLYGFKECDVDAANNVGETWLVSSSESNINKFLHQNVGEKSFETVLIDSSDADTLAERLVFVFSDRRGILSITGRSNMRQTEISDTVQVTRKLLPGNEFDDETTYERSFSVSVTSKDLKTTNLTIEDQKGIEDNSGSW